MSGRYTNYHPIAIHPANLYSSQTCLNETDDCSSNQMHCRTIVYHPAAVYIPHTPPFHNASGGTSLLPTPPSVSQQIFDSSNKSQSLNSRDYSKSSNAQQSSYAKSQNHGLSLSHSSPFAKAQNLPNSQSHKHSSIDGGYKYSTSAMTSRLPMQYNKRTGGSAMGSPACFVAQKSGNYGPGHQAMQKSGNFSSNFTGQSYSSACLSSQKLLNAGTSAQHFEYANGRRNTDQYFDSTIGVKSGNYAARKNVSNSSYRSSATSGQLEGNQSSDSYTTNTVDSSQNLETSNSDKPASPPPAPYSPMTRPLPTLSPPTSQVQFYAPAQNRYQPSLAPSQHQQQASQRRYTVAPTISATRKPSEKYSSSTGSQTTMLRQNKYKVNGIMQAGTKVTDDSLGGAGDAPPGVGRMPITPPGTPRTHPGHPAGDQLSDTCHQMQALSL